MIERRLSTNRPPNSELLDEYHKHPFQLKATVPEHYWMFLKAWALAIDEQRIRDLQAPVDSKPVIFHNERGQELHFTPEVKQEIEKEARQAFGRKLAKDSLK